MRYTGLSSIKKDAQMKELYRLLSSLYRADNHDVYYIEDRKQGLIQISEKSGDLLPSASPTRNQLLIVVVERLSEGDESGRLQRWYKTEMDQVKVQISNEHMREYCWDWELNKNDKVEVIRQVIFDEMLGDQMEEYQSPNNIVIRYRSKKNSKILTEAHDDEPLKDLVKVEKALFFSYSALDTNERLTQKELYFYYRLPNSLHLSDIQKIVIEKNNEGGIVDLIYASKIIKENLPERMNYGYRMFLLAKDRSYINDIVGEKGYVHKKGELLNVVERERHSALVVEQYEQLEVEESLISVLVHHVAKTGEKIGMPRWEYTIGSGLLSALKYYLLEKIEKDEIEYEGKVHQVNPLKVRLLVYAKDWGRA
jgi:hypothetical protein